MQLRSVSFALGLFLLVQMFAVPAPVWGRAGDVARLSSRASGDETKEGTPPPAASDILRTPAPVPTPLQHVSGEDLPKETYRDVYRIIKEDNSCSRFFGGSVQAVEVLNKLATEMRKKPLDSTTVGILMRGTYTRWQNATTGSAYRIFSETTINSRGPFYNVAAANKTVGIGRFAAHTRKGRALMLLHELGHLVTGPDGDWLLPNDGDDRKLSNRNTETVEDHCINQLAALS